MADQAVGAKEAAGKEVCGGMFVRSLDQVDLSWGDMERRVHIFFVWRAAEEGVKAEGRCR